MRQPNASPTAANGDAMRRPGHEAETVAEADQVETPAPTSAATREHRQLRRPARSSRPRRRRADDGAAEHESAAAEPVDARAAWSPPRAPAAGRAPTAAAVPAARTRGWCRRAPIARASSLASERHCGAGEEHDTAPDDRRPVAFRHSRTRQATPPHTARYTRASVRIVAAAPNSAPPTKPRHAARAVVDDATNQHDAPEHAREPERVLPEVERVDRDRRGQPDRPERGQPLPPPRRRASARAASAPEHATEHRQQQRPPDRRRARTAGSAA